MFKKLNFYFLCYSVCNFFCLIGNTYFRPFDPYYSQAGQDKYVIENIFNFKKEGVFFDIGAHDGISYSNSCFLEKVLGWTGICVEPQKENFELLQKNRTCICVNGCIYTSEGEKDFLKVNGPAEMLSGLLESYEPKHLERVDLELSLYGGSKEIIKMQTFTLNNLCKQHNINKIDFLSIDTEGSEEQIIKSIDFDLIDIDVIIVENNYSIPQIKEYLIDKNYELIHNIGVDQIYRKTRK